MKTRILLVEDHPVTQEVMRQELEFLGYEVAVAGNGVQALEMAAASEPGSRATFIARSTDRSPIGSSTLTPPTRRRAAI